MRSPWCLSLPQAGEGKPLKPKGSNYISQRNSAMIRCPRAPPTAEHVIQVGVERT